MSGDESVTVERQSPEAAFGLLSNDLRVDILQALGESEEPMAFSTLREAVGERDSGKFNYHLGKLTGHIVVHEDDGYRLSMAGRQMFGAIVSGAYTTDAELEAFEFEGPCPMCGRDQLVAEYADERALMYCPDCEHWRNEFSFPPASLDQFDREELPYAFDRWMRATISKVVYGFCANCGGRVDGQLEQVDDPENPMPVQVRYDCDRCGDSIRAYPALPVMFDPEAIAFFQAHGVDLLHDPSWRYFEREEDITIEIADRDPLRARVAFRLDGDELEAIVGHDVTLESVTVA